MPGTTVVPFEAFLDILKARGFGVSLHEYETTANLLQHWDGTSAPELGDALAALIGRSDDEVEGIRRLFKEVYAPPPRLPAPVETAAAPDPVARLRRHSWSLAAVGAAVLLILVGVTTGPRPAPLSSPAAVVVPPVTTSNQDQAVTVPPPPEPALPDEPMRVERRPAIVTTGAAFLGALAIFWAMKTREDRRAWLREAWSRIRASLPGPYHYTEVLRDRPVRLPKSDVEDAATMLGRVFNIKAQARALDIPRTLRTTLRRGLMPTLVSKPRRTAETLLILQDVSQEMTLWGAKVEAFLRDLRRQGVALQRMYFDGDITRLSDRPHRPAASIEAVLRARPDSPVLVVGSGTGLAATLAADDQRWLQLLERRPRKTWLTPVADLRLWRRELGALPLTVWPMTRLGLLNAARQLAGIDVSTGPDTRAQMTEDGRVTLADIERLKRLASLVPHPSPALLDLLRQRFGPDVSDAAILHLAVEARDEGGRIIQLSDEELKRSSNAMRRETPELEMAARQTIIGVLLDSEPVLGSMAHERWQIAIEVQHLMLGGLEVELARSGTAGGSGAGEHQVRHALDALRRLAQGVMWEEANEALAMAAAVSAPGMAGLKIGGAPPTDLPPDGRHLAAAGPMPWSWPGFREIVPATLAAAVLLGTALGLSVLPARAVEHVPDAYDLRYAPTPSVSTPQLTIGVRGGATLPQTVDLYQGDQRFRSNVALTDASTVVQLSAADTGHYYQVRSTLPDGNLALSPYVWVTSDQLTFVLIDALPWATVTIEANGSTTAPQQTPFTAALMPGTYQVHFENPDLSPPSTLNQVMTAPAPNSALRVTMPGFNAAQAVDLLMPRAVPAP